jgi:LuxR family quorum sensing-dependent transcriptional regulator
LKPVISDLLTEIESAHTAEEMHALIERTVHGYGFDGYSYHLYRPEDGGLDYVGEWPHEWLNRYEKNHYSDIDPVVEHLLQSMTPFTWSEAVAHRPTNSPERIVMNEARDFGIKEGAEIPVHEYGFAGATFSVFSSSFEDFGSAWTEYRHDLHMFCLYFHEKYRRLASTPLTVPTPHLTRRERECLVLTSRGNTAWEIGEILLISERTAKQHLNSAAAKLGSHSKHHAVVKAILTRIILP